MKWQVVLAAVAATVLALSGSATARDDDPRTDCLDSIERDHCAPATVAAMMTEYDAERAETLAARGVEGVRFYIIGGLPESLPLVSVLSEAGAPPVLSVSAPVDEVFPKPRKMSAAANAETVRQAKALAEAAAAAPAAFAPTAARDDFGCMRSWLVAIERLHGGKVERRVRKQCAEEPLFTAALALAAAARANFPQCEGIEVGFVYAEGGLDGPAGLRRCSVLEGDNPAAGAAVLSAMGNLVLRTDEETPGILTADVELAWAGHPAARGRQAVIAALEARSGGLGPMLSEFSVATGADTVTVTGVVSNINGPDGKTDMACRWVSPSQQTWKKGADGRWRLARWTVGESRRAPYPAPNGNPACGGAGAPAKIVATMAPLKVMDGLPEGCRKLGESLTRMNVCMAAKGGGISDEAMTKHLTSLRAEMTKDRDLQASCAALGDIMGGADDTVDAACE